MATSPCCRPRRVPPPDGRAATDVRGGLPRAHDALRRHRDARARSPRPPRRAGARAVVIVTDHGDGTRAADPPRVPRRRARHRRRGDRAPGAATTSRSARAPAPYPAGRRTATRSSTTCARLGGFGIVAHPGLGQGRAAVARLGRAGSTASSGSTPTASGAIGRADLWRTVAGLSVAAGRGADGAARPAGRSSCEQWDRLAARRPVVGLAAHDAHARLGLRGVGEPYDGCGRAARAGLRRRCSPAFVNVVRVAVAAHRARPRATPRR